MIAAIYARKSTDQTGVAEDAKSVTRQIENATAFIRSKGWTLGSVFQDDGISGAEFERRPGFVALMDALKPQPPFQALVMSEESRLGRSTDMVPYVLGKLAEAGVEVWVYREQRKIALTTPVEKFMVSATSFAADMERWLAQQRGHEALAQKAARGWCVGGRVFGYDNVEIDGHVERRRNETEAAVVRRIFHLRATGVGYAGIAKRLNRDHAVCPRPQQGRPAGWSPITVREVLHRDLYRGLATWNKSKKRDSSGRVAPTRRPPTEWMRVPCEVLRIVSNDEWDAAHASLARARTTMATAIGNRVVVRRDRDSPYLLIGFARCRCGSALSVFSRSHGRYRKHFYGCWAHRKRGSCANGLELPIERVDAAVLAALAGDVLRPAVVSAVVDAVLAAIIPPSVDAKVETLRTTLRGVDTSIRNLTSTLEQGGALPSIIARLAELHQERDQVRGELAAVERLRQVQVDRVSIEMKVQAAVADWRALLTNSVDDGRQLLREVLDGPLAFTPEGSRYRFRGAVQTGALVVGAVSDGGRVSSPTGFEPVFWP